MKMYVNESFEFAALSLKLEHFFYFHAFMNNCTTRTFVH